MTSDELKLRTKKFAHDCIHVAQELPNNYLGNHIKGQLIRCSTSVGANYRAACLSQSKAGFIAKLSISIEEADETAFWLEFSYDEQLLRKRQLDADSPRRTGFTDFTDENRRQKTERQLDANFTNFHK